MAKTGSVGPGKAQMFGGKKGAATPRKRSVPDCNTKCMAGATLSIRANRKGSAGGGKPKGRAKNRICFPPAGGWPGGDPGKNGYK